MCRILKGGDFLLLHDSRAICAHTQDIGGTNSFMPQKISTYISHSHCTVRTEYLMGERQAAGPLGYSPCSITCLTAYAK